MPPGLRWQGSTTAGRNWRESEVIAAGNQEPLGRAGIWAQLAVVGGVGIWVRQFVLGITLHPVFVSSVERGEENVSIAGARGVDLAASLGRIVIALLRAYLPLAVASLTGLASATAAERINQEGRILGPLPVVTNAVLFDTPEADGIVSAMSIFPVTSAWNEDISRRPLLTNSDAMIAQIICDLSSSRRSSRGFFEMNFVLVPDDQAPVPIEFVDYPDESDLNGGVSPYGSYPIPGNMPVEGWPTQTSGETLLQAQQDALGLGGDRHSIVVEPGAGGVFETWEALLSGTNWQAANGAIFNLNTNGQRPAGWTSGDAAGLPMFPALVRYDECERGMVEHACRLVVKRTRYNTYIYPANHYAASSANTNVNLPAMGQRLRLKANFSIPPTWSKEEQALLLGLKKYGGLVADNGNFFSLSITPDDRWPAGAFDDLSSIGITNFEVIQSTGPNEGPRLPGAPMAYAGGDQYVALGTPAALQGFVNYTGGPPAVLWRLYSGPGTATFANPSQTNTTVSFSAPGGYTLMLSADDGVHTVAYAAVVLTAGPSFALGAALAGTNLVLNWSGGAPPFTIECMDSLSTGTWTSLVTTNGQSVSLPLAGRCGFFRVVGQ